MNDLTKGLAESNPAAANAQQTPIVVTLPHVPSAPHRACRLTVLLEADSKEDMLRALDSMGQALSRDELTKGTWGSPSHGCIYEYIQGDSPTHDEYFEQTREYLRSLDIRQQGDSRG